MLLQMHCPQLLAAVAADADIIALDASHRADVLALTALVYPHYFRARTMDLGRYFGIYRDGRLATMIGERMGTAQRSEEHTSELQSLMRISYAGFCLKKTTYTNIQINTPKQPHHRITQKDDTI